METLRVTRIFRFEAAHFLPYHNGLCKNIHGHSYVLEVTVRGTMKHNRESDDAMLIDFSVLKQLVEESVLNRLDHALVVEKGRIPEYAGKKIELEYSPTCEGMLMFIKMALQKHIPHGITLTALKLHETSTSFAEWRLEDQ